MIIVKIQGGMGNQLFQYALGRSISITNDIEFKIDMSKYNGKYKRDFCLNHFNTSYEIADSNDLRKITIFGKKGIFLSREIHPYLPHLSNHLFNYYSEMRRDSIWERYGVPRRFKHQKNVNKINSGYLDGYWQCPKYFDSIRSTLIKELKVKYDVPKCNKKMLNEIKNENSVSIHVRRGDYVEKGLALPPSYYNKSINMISKNVSDPHFFVFSNDINWVKNNIKTPSKITYCTRNTTNDYEDFQLMKCCDHNIISNSTFGWWGAWLNTYNDKCVIAPAYWYKKNSTHETEIIPDQWVVHGDPTRPSKR